MGHKIVKMFGIICVVLLIVGCVEQKTAKADDGRFTWVYQSGDYTILHDNVNNVTIYQIGYASYGYGVAAIPDWQLKAPTNNS